MRSELTVALEDRIRGEFLEMPGLQLTPTQAARLWALDHHLSQRILDTLTSNGFLARTAEGRYLRNDD